jgi:hypothetical protein
MKEATTFGFGVQANEIRTPIGREIALIIPKIKASREIIPVIDYIIRYITVKS